MRLTDKQDKLLVLGKDYPKLMGTVKLTLHNPTTGKTEVYEHHNDPTHALRDIFATNPGGLVNYNNFADLYKTWLGGVLVFTSPLDTSSSGWADNYGIPARTSNAVIAHAGQTGIGTEGQGDDLTRGNPDSSGAITQAGSTKLVWEWGTSAGNGTISSLGLTHTDTGSYFTGTLPENGGVAMKSLNPFAQVGCISQSYAYGDNATAVLGIDNNIAYTFYLTSDTTVDIFKTPINNTKFKLQGGSLVPITDKTGAYTYTTKITATLPSSYERLANSAGQCYYHWDFANNALILFGVPNATGRTGTGGTTLYKDVISLSDGTVSHSVITVTGATLWKFTSSTQSGYGWGTPMQIPTKAMIFNNHLFVYGNIGTGDYEIHPTKMFIINLANTTDITQVDTSLLGTGWLDANSCCASAGRFAMLGEIIAHESFLINGDKMFPLTINKIDYRHSQNYGVPTSISSPVFGINNSYNAVSVNKLYLATKWNLQSSVTKTTAQAMTVEYTLTEV